eukprot:537553_1
MGVCLRTNMIPSSLYLIITFTFLCTSIYALLKYIKNFKNEKENKIKFLFFIGLLHIILSVLTFTGNILSTTYSVLNCFTQSSLLMVIAMVMWMLQTYILWIILFARLYYVFQHSVYKLSQ